jgi:hypothetical protein
MAKYAKPSPKRSAGPSIASPPNANAKLRDYLAGSAAKGSSASDGPRPAVAKLPGQGVSAKLGQFLTEPGPSAKPPTGGKSTGGPPTNRRK